MEKAEYIDRVETEDTGGHVLVDYVYLKTGVVLGVTDDSVAIYQTVEDKERNEVFEWAFFD